MPKNRGSDGAPDGGVELRRQETLLKTGALHQAIFNSANFSSIATDEKGVIQIFNVGAERMMGYAAIDVINKVTPADISDSQQLIARAAALSVELDTPITPGFEALVFKASRGIEDIYELTYIRKDGSSFPAIVSVTALRDRHDLIIGYLLIGTDNTTRQQVVTERKRFERSLLEKNVELEHLAHNDPLTGLPNRTLFYKTLKKTLAQAAERGWLVSVVFIDLDHFKNVNDTLGHAYGDQLLEQFSKRLLQCVRMRDTVARLGGDEFVLILVMREGRQGAAVVADKIRAILRAPFDLNGNELAVTASIGITLYPDDAGDPETLIKYADTAMYRAKQAGRDTCRFFTPQMNAQMLAR